MKLTLLDSVVKELRSRFAHFHETGDDSKIPADLQRVTYRIAVQHGGEKEYEAIKKASLNYERFTSFASTITLFSRLSKILQLRLPRLPPCKPSCNFALGHSDWHCFFHRLAMTFAQDNALIEKTLEYIQTGVSISQAYLQHSNLINYMNIGQRPRHDVLLCGKPLFTFCTNLLSQRIHA